jgi:probable FeS assembly SUF system protein SufT
MSDLETIKLTRDIKATVVPFGNEIDIPKDTEVIVLQALGGTYTVVAGGQTVRVANSYADALGKQPAHEVDAYINDPHLPLVDKVWAQLKTCYDPEIPVNIVDLGLIYAVMVDPEIASKVTIKMTLTAPGCGMGPMIAAEAKQKILAIPGVQVVEIITVFEPPWDRSRLSDAAKLALGLM